MKRKISVIIFILLFFIFLVLYLTNNIKNFDDYFYKLIISIKNDKITEFMKFITFFASIKYTVLFMFITLLLYFSKKKRIYLIINALILGEVVINNIIKLIIGRERPTLINLVTETSYSFPSGHTMLAVVLYGFIIYLINKTNINKYIKGLLNIILIILIILIMMSRIYLGVHYFSDVMSGLCLSCAYLIIMVSLLERRNLI